MTAGLPEAGIQALEEAIADALTRGDESDLRILGYGEITTVVAWGQGERERACKRLPLFSGEHRVAAYRASVEAYIACLRQGGVRPVETAVQHHRRPDGQVAVFCVQPIIPRKTLLTEIFSGAGEAAVVEIFDLLLRGISGCVTPRLGLDAQISNWAMVGGELLYLDISTPMMRDDAGRDILDTDLFIASLPWAMHGVVRRFLLRAIMDKYFDPRVIVVDLLANLYKERLERHVPALLRRANDTLRPAITEEEVKKYYLGDARLWEFLQRVRRLDRWWQRRVRRRAYPFLLPGEIQRHV